MMKRHFRNAILSLLAALPCVGLGVLIGNLTGLWVSKTWGDILLNYVAVSLIVFVGDIVSRPLFKNNLDKE